MHDGTASLAIATYSNAKHGLRKSTVRRLLYEDGICNRTMRDFLRDMLAPMHSCPWLPPTMTNITIMMLPTVANVNL